MRAEAAAKIAPKHPFGAALHAGLLSRAEMRTRLGRLAPETVCSLTRKWTSARDEVKLPRELARYTEFPLSKLWDAIVATETAEIVADFLAALERAHRVTGAPGKSMVDLRLHTLAAYLNGRRALYNTTWSLDTIQAIVGEGGLDPGGWLEERLSACLLPVHQARTPEQCEHAVLDLTATVPATDFADTRRFPAPRKIEIDLFQQALRSHCTPVLERSADLIDFFAQRRVWLGLPVAIDLDYITAEAMQVQGSGRVAYLSAHDLAGVLQIYEARGVDPQTCWPRNGGSLLHGACSALGGELMYRMVAALLDAGVDPERLDSSGASALSLMQVPEERQRVEEMFRSAGARSAVDGVFAQLAHLAERPAP